MSPSWRDRIYIAFSPEHISMLKLGRGLKSKLQASHDEAIATDENPLSGQAASDRISQLLGEQEWQNAEVNIVLSNRLVRYAAISFSAQLKNYSEQEAFARHSLTQTFGATVEQWELRIQHGKAGTPGLVSAVDRALLDGLRQACSAHRMKLRSVTPYLMPVFNHYRKSITSDPTWMVIDEPGYSLFALLSGGEFISVNGVYHDTVAELPMLLDRENLVGTFTEPCKSVYVYSNSGNALLDMPAMGYEFIKLDIAALEGFPSPADGLYAMAMSGVM